MRIVHCFRAPVGGVLRHVWDLCKAQTVAGHDVGIICDSTTGGPLEEKFLQEAGATLSLGLYRTPMQRQVGLGDLTAAARTLRAVRRMRPDILHGHGAKGGVYARLFGTAMRASGRRVARLYSPHGGSLHYDPHSRSGRFYFTVEAMLGRFTDHILFVSQYEERTYEEKVGKLRAPASIVYNGLDREEFAPVADAADAADFLFVGTMRELKGPDLFLDALKRTEKQTGRSLSAVLVGDGEEQAIYVQQATTLGLSGWVSFRPSMPAREAFPLGRVMVVPSRAEALPYIVLEALAARKPVVSTAVGGIPEIFGQESPALCQPDAASIAEKMVAACTDEDAYRRQMPSDDSLKARFSVETMAREIEAVYKQALGA